MRVVSDWFESAFDRLPTRCPLCQLSAKGGHLCAGCERDCFEHRQRRLVCRICGADSSQAQNGCFECHTSHAHINALACALDYDFVAESLIHMYKECRQIALARLFGALMVRAGEPLLQQYQPIAWVPVPASAQRLRTNGFSPAQQIAQAVARRTGIACRVDWLRLTREGQAQKTLNRDQRVQAMIGRFAADPAVYGRCVGLIDDVITTGSTVAAAASAFKAAGARSVVVLAAARTPQRL